MKAVDLAKIDPASFSEDEWWVPYYLKHFAAVANSVQDTEENRGYFNVSVWRGSENHHPYNARVMEGILSLVWFYCTERPWNVYYGDPALKQRIEAALEFWCTIQNEDGRFSEYGDRDWGLAPTAFATKFIGRALWLLGTQGPSIDRDVFEQARVALRKALSVGLTNRALWEHGKHYANQFSNLWGGALAYLDLWPDPPIEHLLKQRFQQSLTALQSPFGFFYEKGGPDWRYSLGTHRSNLQVAWEYADEEVRALIIEKTRDWYTWFSYNAVKEPDSMCYYLNRAIETRTRKGFHLPVELEDPATQRWIPQAEFVPVARAFAMTAAEYSASTTRQYQHMRGAYPEVADLDVGDFRAFSPYAFLHHNMKRWYPSPRQREDAIANLPYRKHAHFVKVMHDGRSNTSYSFVRASRYYAIFNAGQIITRQQRFGLGLIWTPKLGTVFQSQSGTDEAAFGTRPAGATQVYEAFDLMPTDMLTPVEPQEDFQSSTVSYRLGNHGEKSITFEDETIRVEVHHRGRFTELLPLLLTEADQLSMTDGMVHVEGQEGSLVIRSSATDGMVLKRSRADLANKHCRVVEISAANQLTYEFSFQ